MKNAFEFRSPLTGARKRRSPYIPNRESVESVVSAIADKQQYVSIVGPRYSGKTSLVGEILDNLRESPRKNVTCVLDFKEAGGKAEPECFQHMADAVGMALDKSGLNSRGRERGRIRKISNAYRFGLFLRNVLTVGSALFIFVADHLEALEREVAKSILRCFRTLHDERELHPVFGRLVLLCCGSLSLHRLTSAEHSPFNVSKILTMKDLTEDQAVLLVHNGFRASGLTFSGEAVDKIVDATEGDRYLIQRICSDLLERVKTNGRQKITRGLVDEVGKDFVSCADKDRCMRESFRRIQSDELVQTTVFDVLEKKHIKFRELNTIIDIGDCELSGAVKITDHSYLPRNPIYEDSVATRLYPLYENRGKVEQYMEKCKATFEDIRNRQICMMQIIETTEALTTTYRSDRYLSHALSLISDAIHYTKSENMTIDQVDHLDTVFKDHLKVGMGKDDAKECLRFLQKHHFIVSPRVARISELYKE